MADMNCQHWEDSLYAYIDGECSSEEQRMLEAHLHICANCRTQIEKIRHLDARLRQAASHEQAPPQLWERIRNQLPMPTLPVFWDGLLENRWHPAPVFAAAALLLLLILTPLWQITVDSNDGIVFEPVNDFITYRISQRELDVSSDDPATVKQWFHGKIDFPLPSVRQRLAGYRLIGSRLCYFLDRRLSALMYQKGEHMISLYIMPSDGLELPSKAWQTVAQRKITSHQLRGHTSLIWREGALIYALVSDSSTTEMLHILSDLPPVFSRTDASTSLAFKRLLSGLAARS